MSYAYLQRLGDRLALSRLPLRLRDVAANRRVTTLAMIAGLGIIGALSLLHVRQTERALPAWSLQAVRAGKAEVPREFFPRLPPAAMRSAPTAERKRHFLKILLPLVLHANDSIRRDRARLLRLLDRRAKGERLPRRDRRWLARLAERYAVASTDEAALRRRVDAIPPSLALAQAAIESGWGTSRFALEGNALFGLWTWREKDGLIPRARAATARHSVRKYDALDQSVRGYIHTLNTHRAYRGLRQTRARMRAEGRRLDSFALADHLKAYATKDGYLMLVKHLMRRERLPAFDSVKLEAE